MTERKQLNRKYFKRKEGLIGKLLDFYSEEEINAMIDALLPSKQSFINWMSKNYPAIVKEYALLELAKPLLLKIQLGNPEKLEEMYESLEELPVGCLHCGSLPQTNDTGAYICTTNNCLLHDMNYGARSILEWNEDMNRFKK